MIATDLRHNLRHSAHTGAGGNPHQRRFRPLGDVSLFEKMLRINVLGDILAAESGYEEGCRRGASYKLYIYCLLYYCESISYYFAIYCVYV
jgi:hypothetical protein